MHYCTDCQDHQHALGEIAYSDMTDARNENRKVQVPCSLLLNFRISSAKIKHEIVASDALTAISVSLEIQI